MYTGKKLAHKILPVLLMVLATIACNGSPQGTEFAATVLPENTKPSVTETLSQVITTIAPSRTSTPEPDNTKTPLIAASSTSTAAPEPVICSPLSEVQIDDLVNHISNQFNPPRPGSDDAHQGVDLAILSDPDRYAIAGAAVDALLSGRVAGVVEGMFPYGNAVLVETPIEQLPPWTAGSDRIPTIAPTFPPHPSLTCPQTGEYPNWDSSKRSIYILYAHMQEPPAQKPGDRVLCGDELGRIGQTGNALNPHLHLEVRVGPSGASLSGMAHYETRAAPQNMEAYCIWRVSGIFQLLNPFDLITPADPGEN